VRSPLVRWTAARRPALAAVAIGIAADWLLGEPPQEWHPVAGFGRVMQGLEERWYADTRRRGMLHAASGTALAAAAGWLLTAGIPRRSDRRQGRSRTARQAEACRRGRADRRGRAGRRGRAPDHLRAAVAAAVATYVAVAARALSEAARQVAEPLETGDLDLARRRLPTLVGRDPAGFGAAEITRAVVESVAENTVDAVIAPAVWVALAGPAGGLAYRALNTLDAMVGHLSSRYARFGWAAARADDVAGWLPARLTALLVAGVRPGAAAAVLSAVRDQAPAHPSPNAGVAEAAFAAALGVRLGGINVYDGRPERRATLGSGPPPGVADIKRAVRLSRDVTAAAAAAAAGAAMVASRGSTRSGPGWR
jgi:adenosylcobinamide-phosphate synthase